MTRTPRWLPVGAVTLAVAVGLAACGDTRTGAAALVGADRISTGQLAAAVDRGLVDPQAAQQVGGDRPTYERRQLSRLINREVLRVAAEDQGVSVSEGEVDAQLKQFEDQVGGAQALQQQAAQNGIAPADLRPYVRDLVLRDALADKLVATEQVDPKRIADAYNAAIGQFDQVHAADILVKDKAQSDEILARVRADPAAFAELARRYSIDASTKDKGGDLGYAGRGQFAKPFEDAVFAARPGDVFSVQTDFGWHVVTVLDRRTTTLEQATPQLRRQLLKPQIDERLTPLLTATAKRLGVEVNPRFGRYEAASGEVVPTTGGVVTPAPDGGGLGEPLPEAPSGAPSGPAAG